MSVDDLKERALGAEGHTVFKRFFFNSLSTILFILLDTALPQAPGSMECACWAIVKGQNLALCCRFSLSKHSFTAWQTTLSISLSLTLSSSHTYMHTHTHTHTHTHLACDCYLPYDQVCGQLESWREYGKGSNTVPLPD